MGKKAPEPMHRDGADPLGSVLPWIVAMGILGLAGVTLLERLVPVLPSTALLVALGVAVGDGQWSMSSAFFSSTLGSLLGCLSFYGLGLMVGEIGSFALLNESARWFGISQARLRRLSVFFRRHSRTIVFGSQLIPSVRLIAPSVAGALRVAPREFLMATTLGIALWNSLFIAAGYVSGLKGDSAEISDLALKLVLAVFIVEVIAAAAWRSIVVRRTRIEVDSFKSGSRIKTAASS